jgi:hypothetical protein
VSGLADLSGYSGLINLFGGSGMAMSVCQGWMVWPIWTVWHGWPGWPAWNVRAGLPCNVNILLSHRHVTATCLYWTLCRRMVDCSISDCPSSKQYVHGREFVTSKLARQQRNIAQRVFGVTNSVQQRPSWEANSCSTSQEILHLWCIFRIHFASMPKSLKLSHFFWLKSCFHFSIPACMLHILLPHPPLSDHLQIFYDE